MTTAPAHNLESTRHDVDDRAIPDLRLAVPPLGDPRSFDPTQGRTVGFDPYDDPTQGRKLGSDPYDDPTRGR
jgi:hypothetical protein